MCLKIAQFPAQTGCFCFVLFYFRFAHFFFLWILFSFPLYILLKIILERKKQRIWNDIIIIIAILFTKCLFNCVILIGYEWHSQPLIYQVNRFWRTWNRIPWNFGRKEAILKCLLLLIFWYLDLHFQKKFHIKNSRTSLAGSRY